MGTVSETDVPTVVGVSSRQRSFVPRGGRGGDGQELVARIVSSHVTLRARLRELWNARELFVFLVRKDLKVKYKNSFLGFLWSMLNPAFVLLVYYVVFKYFLKNPTPYFALYLFSGLLIWNLFQTATTGSASVIVANSGIVKKVAFPARSSPSRRWARRLCSSSSRPSFSSCSSSGSSTRLPGATCRSPCSRSST